MRSIKYPIISTILVLSAALPEFAQTIGSDYFGLHASTGVTYREPWPALPFGGVRLLSSETDWALLNPAPGVYDWTTLDRWLNAIQVHGMNGSDVIYTFNATPRWASSNPNDYSCKGSGPGACDPPNDLNPDGTGANQHWKDFVTALTGHVAGRITYWEVWNEPAFKPFFTGTPAQITRLAKDLRAIAQVADPSAKILSPPISDYHLTLTTACYAANTMDHYFAAGIGPYIDIVSFHAYFAVPAGPDAPENYTSQVACIEKMMANRGQQNKPLWASEGGWGRESDLPDLDQQAAYVARAYLILRSIGVERFYWYRWDNTTWGTLWSSGTGVNKAGVAYREVANWMIGSTLTSPCSADSTQTWNCGFTLASGAPAEAVWTLESQLFTAHSYYTKYRDIAGHTYNLPPNHQITIGYKPVLLE
jgi:hypothetical protein